MPVIPEGALNSSGGGGREGMTRWEGGLREGAKGGGGGVKGGWEGRDAVEEVRGIEARWRGDNDRKGR